MARLLTDRTGQVGRAGDATAVEGGKHSAAGAISQRACVFCGSRVVLYPLADALHVVHGPAGCAAYTWDIRGAQSSGPQLHRNSFSTDLREKDVIYGGEKKLYASLLQLIDKHRPAAAFVYSTCVAGVIGDDIGAVCKKVEKEKGIPVLPVKSEGFGGTKKDGYRAACDALFRLVGTVPQAEAKSPMVNLLGEFNVAGETWILKSYLKRMGIEVACTLTGDGRVEEVRRSHGAALNLVQCSGSMLPLARLYEEKYGIPYRRVSFFGLEDTAAALYEAASFFNDPSIMERTAALVKEGTEAVLPELKAIRRRVQGKRAAIYVGGAFKAFSLVKALRTLGVKTVLVGTQTGNGGDYARLQALCDPGTIVVDDSNPAELSAFLEEQGADVLVGGVKERPLAYKVGVGFCDHNHERKLPLAGFEGMVHFARELDATISSPVWKWTAARRRSFRGAP
jgi:nitrogenase molybdenum-cofactor synthesis protein NifE